MSSRTLKILIYSTVGVFVLLVWIMAFTLRFRVALAPTSTTTVQNDSAAIAVFSPAPHQKVKKNIVVSGQARVFENQFNIEILDSLGRVLTSTPGYANASDVGLYGNFLESLFVDYAGKAVIRVFDASPKDGSPQDVVSIPIIIEE